MKTLTIFLDGQYQKISQEALKELSPGFLKGLGVFETLICRQGKAFYLLEHYRRFLHGVDCYILPKPPAIRHIRNILTQLLKANGIKDARIRLASWRKGYQSHWGVFVSEHRAFSEADYRRGFWACIYPRRMDRSFHLAKVKSLAYGFFLKAYDYALKHHCQEALLLNSSGQIVEGSRSNIFFVKDSKLFTPAVSTGCLAGVTRQAVLGVAKNLHIKISTHATLEGLQNCDEAFLTNASIGVMPLTKFAGYKIGNGHPGALTKRISAGYKKLSEDRATFLV